MKTKIYRILLALPVLAMMTACEGMLNLTPEDRVTPATFFNTESNLELFTNNFSWSCSPTTSTLPYCQEGPSMKTRPMASSTLSSMRPSADRG